MHDSTMFGRALTPVELSNARYLDALVTFRPESCLSMTQGAAEGGGASAAEGGDQGAQQGGSSDASAQQGSGGQQGSQQAGSQGSAEGGAQGADKGFPADTPVAEMKPEEQAAYWRHQAQKHEGRYKNLTGDRSFDDTKKALDEYARIQREQQTPAEQALTAAREEGQKAGTAAARNEAATAIFKGALEAGGLKPEDVTELVDSFAVSKYVSDEGIDTTGIHNLAKRLAPGTGTSQVRDFGQGNRGNGPKKSGVAAGAEMFAASKKPAPTSS